MMKTRVLLIDTDNEFGIKLKRRLIENDYEVFKVCDTIRGFDAVKRKKIDCCIINFHVFSLKIEQLIKKIMNYNNNIRILILFDQYDKNKILQGYKNGMHDFLIKPADKDVIVMKMNALLKNYCSNYLKFVTNEYEFGRYWFNSENRLLKYRQQDIKVLSPKESHLLELLINKQNDLMSRDLALREIWKENNAFTSKCMDVYIAKLRGYLSKDDKISIANIRDSGFRLIV